VANQPNLTARATACSNDRRDTLIGVLDLGLEAKTTSLPFSSLGQAMISEAEAVHAKHAIAAACQS